ARRGREDPLHPQKRDGYGREELEPPEGFEGAAERLAGLPEVLPRIARRRDPLVEVPDVETAGGELRVDLVPEERRRHRGAGEPPHGVGRHHRLRETVPERV